MAFALKHPWISDGRSAHDGKRGHGYFLKADQSIGDPELPHMNQETGAIAHG
ncbi:hypothetical protein [Mesorhizobium sp.]|uniref:hypothetical protein n=1 Tax=Mesorhizobium sp. TaxID=1871066 RepID=UPI0025F74D8E|nr:hypothetical protein [Mesorhizobium sp.]